MSVKEVNRTIKNRERERRKTSEAGSWSDCEEKKIISVSLLVRCTFHFYVHTHNDFETNLNNERRALHCIPHSEKISILNTIISISLHYIRAYLCRCCRCRCCCFHSFHSFLYNFDAKPFRCCFLLLLLFRILVFRSFAVSIVMKISSWDAKRGKTIKTNTKQTHIYVAPKKNALKTYYTLCLSWIKVKLGRKKAPHTRAHQQPKEKQ